MQRLIVLSFLILLPASGALPVSSAKSRCCACLPQGILRTDVVSYRGFKPNPQQSKQAITVAEKLASMKAHCKEGRLLDGKRREIRFFHLTGCWGNPPADYQEILAKQARDLAKLKKRYTVIEMTCNPSGEMVQ